MRSNDTLEDIEKKSTYRYGKTVGVILCTVLLLMILLGISVYRDIQQGKGSGTDAAEDQLGLYVTNITQGLVAHDPIERINWYQEESTGKYYLFLPSATDLRKIKIGLSGMDTIMLDGEEIADGEKVNLTIGEHQGSFTESGETFTLEVMESQNIGTLFLTTESGSMDYLNEDKENTESGSMLLLNGNGDIEYKGILSEIHGRGNSTWDDGKKLPYTIKLQQKADLFHMGSAKKWVLLANEWDHTLMRNYVVHDMARNAQVQFAAESVFVDFYTNGDYQGTYQLGEKIEVGSERVAIPDLEKETENVNPGVDLASVPMFGQTEEIRDTTPSTMKGYQIENNPVDITGGYIIDMDMGYSYLKRPAGFVTSRNQALNIREPKHPSVEQVYYIANLYQEMEDAIYDWNGVNPNTGKPYYEYMDIDSFARKYLVEEISKNLDASTASQYMYKYPDATSTKLYAGPIWDYDKSLGNPLAYGYNSEDLTDPNGMYASQDITDSCIWYAVFFRPEFSEAVVENYWNLFRDSALSESNGKIDNLAEELQDSAAMNAVRWNIYGTDDVNSIQGIYTSEVETMKDFVTDRIAFLDTQWVQQ